ncbi:hypothetical protein B0H11DRAFT_1942270 [Mycena galericulata]|nr:hypothetical protein B0H11DRAFT_1942270 [Mycena galericulata]
MHGIYCHRYYMKNREQVNDKTRERMRRLRASDVTVRPEVLVARLEARRAAAKAYREKNQWKLKMKARAARAAAAEERRQASTKNAKTSRRRQGETRRAATQRLSTFRVSFVYPCVLLIDHFWVCYERMAEPFLIEVSTTDCTPSQQTLAEPSDADSNIQGLTDVEHASNRACVEKAALRCEDDLRLRRQLHCYNSLSAAWERYEVYLFLGALRLAMVLQIAHDQGIDLGGVAVDIP